MIVTTAKGDILAGKEAHVAFGISTEGKQLNCGGFSGVLISKGIWPELATIGGLKLGQVISREDLKTGRIYHAMAVHSFGGNGWGNSPAAVLEALSKIPAPTSTTIAMVEIGTGSAGKSAGADAAAIRAAMQKSARRVVLYEY